MRVEYTVYLPSFLPIKFAIILRFRVRRAPVRVLVGRDTPFCLWWSLWPVRWRRLRLAFTIAFLGLLLRHSRVQVGKRVYSDVQLRLVISDVMRRLPRRLAAHSSVPLTAATKGSTSRGLTKTGRVERALRSNQRLEPQNKH